MYLSLIQQQFVVTHKHITGQTSPILSRPKINYAMSLRNIKSRTILWTQHIERRSV